MSQSFTMPVRAFEQLNIAENMLKKQLVGDRVHATEVFTAQKLKDVYGAMDARKLEIETLGGAVHHRARIGRNSPCLCGSGFKFKKCCEGKASITP
jgi:uncharacterized protein YecA (UPF0149 family)